VRQKGGGAKRRATALFIRSHRNGNDFTILFRLGPHSAIEDVT